MDHDLHVALPLTGALEKLKGGEPLHG